MTGDALREKDRAVLRLIADGYCDLRSIREQTENQQGVATLSNSEVNWCFQKLQEQGCIEVETFPDERIVRTVNGQERSFDRPKEARLTADGEEVLAESDATGLGQYENMEYADLVRTVRDLTERVDQLEGRQEAFREQILAKLEESEGGQ